MTLLTEYANIHIAFTVINMPLYDSLLPGGIHRGVGPEGIQYPFAVMTYSGGSDKFALTEGVAVGGGLVYQIKVVDIGLDESKAANAYEAISMALIAANNSNASGAYVVGQEEAPLDLPITERDQTFQQIGGSWRFWIDPA